MDDLVVRRTTGTVVSLQTGPPSSLTITLGRDPTQIPGVRFAASYTPTAGDYVAVDVVGRVHTVVWKLAQ